ncbi:MAG: hypothetical protein AAF098_19790 [Pseudomonadota bacterium]
MENYAFWAIALGCLILLFEALKEYRTADALDNLKSNNQSSRKELENVRMSALTTDPENKRGRLIYVILFFVLYGILLLFPEVIDTFVFFDNFSSDDGDVANVQVRSIVNVIDNEVVGNTAPIDTSLPLALAIAITLGATSPTFQVIERRFRAIAYYFAGVPRNIFRLLQVLEGFDYSKYGSSDELPLFSSFKERIDESSSDKVLAGIIQSTETSLRCIDLLQLPIIGSQRTAFRQLFTDDAPLSRIDELTRRYHALAESIRTITVDIESLQSLHEESIELCDSIQCYFGLYAVRSKKVPASLENTPTGEILRKLNEEDTAQSIHDITVTVFLGSVLSYLVVIATIEILKGDSSSVLSSTTATAMLMPLIPALALLSFMTIFHRHMRVDQGTWSKKRTAQVPFWDYAKAGFWPALIATISYGVITSLAADGVIRLAMLGDAGQMVTRALEFLRSEIQQLPRIFGLSYFFTFGLLFTSDRHDNLRWHATLISALLVGVFLILVSVSCTHLFSIGSPSGTGLSPINMAFLVSLPFIIVLIIYASVAELSEANSVRRVITMFSVHKTGHSQ